RERLSAKRRAPRATAGATPALSLRDVRSGTSDGGSGAPLGCAPVMSIGGWDRRRGGDRDGRDDADGPSCGSEVMDGPGTLAGDASEVTVGVDGVRGTNGFEEGEVVDGVAVGGARV